MHGLPLLVHAIAAGQEQLAEMLVLHGAEVDAVDGGSPPLLLADEATSAADALTEAELITALRAVRCTLITAAHRLSAITPNADHVVVFKAGRVAEQGTHTALLAQDGEYRRLWRAQEQER